MKWASAQDCWPPHAAVALCRSEYNQLAERAARAAAWGSSAKWNMPFWTSPQWRRCCSDKDVCLCRERGWASYQIAIAIVPGWTDIIEAALQLSPNPFTLFLLRLICILQLNHKHAVCSHSPSLCFPDFILFHPYSSRSLLGWSNTEMSFCAGADGTRRTLHPQVHWSLSFFWRIHLSVVTQVSGPSPILRPPRPSPEQAHSFASSPSSILLFPLWALGRCVAPKQALLIEHLFRHGAGSEACGRAAAGFKQGETLCHITYLDMSCSLVCMPIWDAPTEAHSFHHRLRHCSFPLTWQCKRFFTRIISAAYIVC